MYSWGSITVLIRMLSENLGHLQGSKESFARGREHSPQWRNPGWFVTLCWAEGFISALYDLQGIWRIELTVHCEKHMKTFQMPVEISLFYYTWVTWWEGKKILQQIIPGGVYCCLSTFWMNFDALTFKWVSPILFISWYCIIQHRGDWKQNAKLRDTNNNIIQE